MRVARCRTRIDTTANFDDRNLFRDHRNDGRIVGGHGDSRGGRGRPDSMAGLAKGTGFVELRTRQEPSARRRRPRSENASLKGLSRAPPPNLLWGLSAPSLAG